MKLVNYGPGEISARLTILSLKILYGTESGKDVTHFETEQTALLQQIRSRTLNGSWFEQVLQLAAVNGALWTAEDELRGYRARYPRPAQTVRESDGDEVITLAFRIQALNDRRASLVQAINTLAGEHNGSEKL